MSLDKSLKSSGALERHRNVLTRAERITKLIDDGQWQQEDSPFGLPKVAHRRAKVGGKTRKKTDETAESKETKK